jgi:hypothetical protein
VRQSVLLRPRGYRFLKQPLSRADSIRPGR